MANNWASEASPTLGCSIEISRDIYIFITYLPRSLYIFQWLVTILSLLVKYLVILHADPCNKSYIYVCLSYVKSRGIT